jgi:hypothetical protein
MPQPALTSGLASSASSRAPDVHRDDAIPHNHAGRVVERRPIRDSNPCLGRMLSRARFSGNSKS